MSYERIRNGVAACWIGAERSQLMKEIGQKSGKEIIPLEGGIKDLKLDDLTLMLAALGNPGYAVLRGEAAGMGYFYVLKDHDYSQHVIKRTQDLLTHLRDIDLPVKVIDTVDLKCLGTNLRIDLSKYPVVYHNDDCSTTYE